MLADFDAMKNWSIKAFLPDVQNFLSFLKVTVNLIVHVSETPFCSDKSWIRKYIRLFCEIIS
jgi:hypothetical protein